MVESNGKASGIEKIHLESGLSAVLIGPGHSEMLHIIIRC